MRYTFGVGKYFGIPVKVHFTFPLILVLFGAQAWRSGTPADALRAVILVIAVFICVVLHEFGHSLQVKRYGIKVRDIVLLPIGGMARAERIPENPWQEIVVAISGPIVNFVIAALLIGGTWLATGHPLPGNDFVANLLVINMVLGLFNLIPAFPMDGGRILRGMLATQFSYLRATRYAKAVGQVIALGFIILGFVNSAFIMLPVIAVFIFFGAATEEQLIRVRAAFADRVIRDVMPPDPTLVLVSDRIGVCAAGFAATPATAFGVTDTSRTMTGAVFAKDVRRAVSEGRGEDPVGTIMSFELPVLLADMSAIQAYYFLKAQRRRLAGVVDGGIYLGVVDFAALLNAARD